MLQDLLSDTVDRYSEFARVLHVLFVFDCIQHCGTSFQVAKHKRMRLCLHVCEKCYDFAWRDHVHFECVIFHNDSVQFLAEY